MCNGIDREVVAVTGLDGRHGVSGAGAGAGAGSDVEGGLTPRLVTFLVCAVIGLTFLRRLRRSWCFRFRSSGLPR
jgi:hypothetical protein